MGNELGPGGVSDRNSRDEAVLQQFECRLDALMPPVTQDDLMMITWQLLMDTFDYSSLEATTRTMILQQQRDVPTEHELEDFAESLPEMLKLGLFDKLPEEYIIQFGTEAFDEWIGPFIRSVLRGHIEGSESLEHINECPERFCPTEIIACFVNDRLRDQQASIYPNVGYAPYTEEMIHMNVRIVQELRQLGIYDETSADNVLGEYQWWLQSINDWPISYNEELFKYPQKD